MSLHFCVCQSYVRQFHVRLLHVLPICLNLSSIFTSINFMPQHFDGPSFSAPCCVQNASRQTNQTLCVWRCFLTFDFCAKARPQTMHWNGFSPVCERVCCSRSKFLVNDLSQYWHGSPRGVARAHVLLASTIDGLTTAGDRLTALLLATVVTNSLLCVANTAQSTN